LKDRKNILKKVVYKECPWHQNGYDYTLFGFVTVLHLANQKTVTSNTFSQKNITSFRNSLYKILSSTSGTIPNPRGYLSREFIVSFFSTLKDSNCPSDSDPFLEHYEALIASRKSFKTETVRNSLLQNLKIAREEYNNNLPVKLDEGIEVKKVDVDDNDGTVSNDDADENWSFGKDSSEESEDSDDSEDKAHIGNIGFIKDGTVADTTHYSNEVFKENFTTNVPVFNNLD
jgi:hypothetical protein